MIESITLKNVATYDNEGVAFDNLCKINLLYGANATGKTTFSNYIQSLQEHSTSFELYKDCSICWENDSPLECFVYNKNFKEQYFTTDELPGIFTLGKASKEQKDAIAKAKNELNQVIVQKNTYEKSKSEIDQEQKTLNLTFQQKVWQQIFKVYDNDFYAAFNGVRNSKENFCNKLLTEYKTNKSKICTLDDLRQRARVVFSNTPSKIDALTLVDNTTCTKFKK